MVSSLVLSSLLQAIVSGVVGLSSLLQAIIGGVVFGFVLSSTGDRWWCCLCFFFSCLLQAIVGGISLVLYSQIACQAPQFSFSEVQLACDGFFDRLLGQTPMLSLTGYPLESSKVDVQSGLPCTPPLPPTCLCVIVFVGLYSEIVDII